MSGVSKLRHVAAANPAGRGSISTEEAREVLAELDAIRARLAALDVAAQELSNALDRLPAAPLESIVQVHNRLAAALKRNG